VPVEGNGDAYKVQFATGNWLQYVYVDPWNEYFVVTDIEEDATEFNFYLIDGNQRGRFGWNVNYMGSRVDNNGAGNTLSPWDIGKLTGVTTGNNVWQIYDVAEHREVVIPDGSVDSYAADADQHCDVLSYMRTLPNKQWNALYVPFKIPYETLKDNYDVAYVNSIHSYDNDEDGQIDKLTMEVEKIKDGTLKANHPYLIRAKDEDSRAMNLVLKNTTLCATECVTLDCSSVYIKYEITGTYSTMTSDDLKKGSLVITTSGAWQRLSSSSRLKPFRFYLTISPRGGSPVELEESALSRINICVQGEDDFSTGIEEGMSETPANASPVYDLSGRRVKVPTKGGVYIVNGKKVVF
jgi:hypothetical protein